MVNRSKFFNQGVIGIINITDFGHTHIFRERINLQMLKFILTEFTNNFINLILKNTIPFFKGEKI